MRAQDGSTKSLLRAAEAKLFITPDFHSIWTITDQFSLAAFNIARLFVHSRERTVMRAIATRGSEIRFYSYGDCMLIAIQQRGKARTLSERRTNRTLPNEH